MQFRVVLEIEADEKRESFDEIEKRVKTKVFESGQELIKLILGAYEAAWISQHKSARFKDRKIGRFKSSLGEFEFDRIKVKYKGKYFYPIDQWIGLTPYRRETPAFQEIIKNEFIERPFRKGAKRIKETTGVKLKATSGWESFQDIATREKREKSFPALIKNLPLEKPPLNKNNPCPIICIEQDGTFCRAQPVPLKDHDVKLAVLYTEKKFVGKKHKRAILQNKTVVTSKRGESIDSFTARVAWIAREVYGVNEDTCVILRGDGDPWILRLKYDYFDKAHYFLDWWHVKKKLRMTFGKEPAEIMMEHIYDRDPEGLLKFIDENYLSIGCHPKFYDAVESFYNYIENNREGLLPSGIPYEFKKNYPGMFRRGSGVIERNIDLVIGERCKLKRMSWSARGLDNMIFLRENKINSQINSPLLKKVS